MKSRLLLLVFHTAGWALSKCVCFFIHCTVRVHITHCVGTEKVCEPIREPIRCYSRIRHVTVPVGLDLHMALLPFRSSDWLHTLQPAHIIDALLGAFAELRKATVSFVISVCPSVRLSVRMEQLGSPTGRICIKFENFPEICREKFESH
jgi:hypothetical protein